jgi:hypothetical protein
MKVNDNPPIDDYDVGSSTTADPEDTEEEPVDELVLPEQERYSKGKPRRIIIRARIIHD